MNSYLARLKTSERRWFITYALLAMGITYIWTENLWPTLLVGLGAELLDQLTYSLTTRLDAIVGRRQE